jgi:hypothetical protein
MKDLINIIEAKLFQILSNIIDCFFTANIVFQPIHIFILNIKY